MIGKVEKNAIEKALVSVDNSTLVSVATCTTQAAIRYVLGLTTVNEVATLLSGDAGHQALARHFRGAKPERVIEKYESVYRAWAEENVSRDDRLSWANTKRILRRWVRKNPLDRFPFSIDPNDVEVGFAVRLDHAGEVVFVGRIDLIGTDADGITYPIDHKFTGKIWSDHARQFYMDSQMSGYVWATRTRTGRDVPAAYINAVEFGKLPVSTRPCPRHSVPYAECSILHANWAILGPLERTDLELETWRKNAERLARKFHGLRAAYQSLESVRSAPQEGKFTRQCKWCPFFDYCAGGRQVKHAKSMLVHHPWEPFAGAFGARDHRTSTRTR